MCVDSLLHWGDNISWKWLMCQLLWWILLEHPCILNGFIQAASLSAIVIYIFGGFCFSDIDKDMCFISFAEIFRLTWGCHMWLLILFFLHWSFILLSLQTSDPESCILVFVLEGKLWMKDSFVANQKLPSFRKISLMVTAINFLRQLRVFSFQPPLCMWIPFLICLLPKAMSGGGPLSNACVQSPQQALLVCHDCMARWQNLEKPIFP